MPQTWHIYRLLIDHELLQLSSTNPKSFDNLNFGPLSVGAMIVLAQLL
ncbi:hypothetical protein L1F06_019130 [Ectopseudomonas hydrolytica]|uniref:Uncharacterized protein n=1 Tax=Ectopseudomonas hydrolytica TaxID=2493633 RepID=A0ABY5A4I4_9GAMM|nr:hypothetical protein [Pseudomonas hydrolytica]USR38768.1 hypothetical protein L1F06_019130 [Pseudomonas hydrolytica]